MKKINYFKSKHLFGGVLMLLALSFYSCSKDKTEEPVVADSYEPNNTILEAKDGAMGTAISANIADATDVDFFKVTTATEGTNPDILKFTLTNSSTANFSLVIYDSNKKQIAQVPYAGSSVNLNYSLTTTGNTFYVQVLAKDATTYPANYSLNVAYTNAADAFEPNNVIGSAALLPLTTVNNCNFLTNDVDFYQIQDLSTSGVWDMYDVTLVNKTLDMNPSMNIFDEAKSEITAYATANAGAGLGITKTIMMRSGASNSRYVKISTSSTIASAATANYTLQVTKKNVNEASEPNDIFSQARQITATGTYSGVIMKSNSDLTTADIDYIRIAVPAGTSGSIVMPTTSSSGIAYDFGYSFSPTTAPSIFTNGHGRVPSSINWDLSNSTSSIEYYYLKIWSTTDNAAYSIVITL